jgi:hypothetical protein
VPKPKRVEVEWVFKDSATAGMDALGKKADQVGKVSQ